MSEVKVTSYQPPSLRPLIPNAGKWDKNTIGVLGLDAASNVVKRITLAEEQLAGIDNLVLFRAKADRTVDVIATIKNEIEQPVAEE